MNSVLVTGANGMLGAHLCRRWAPENSVVACVRKDPSHPFLRGLPIRTIRVDLSDRTRLEADFPAVDTVVHCAGLISYSRLDEAKMIDANVRSTKNVLHAARRKGVRRVVVVSSTAAVGIPVAGEVADEGHPFFEAYDRVPYMRTKRTAEEAALSLSEDLDIRIASPATILGEGDHHMNTGKLFRSLASSGFPLAPPGGTAYVSINDCALGIEKILDQGKSGEKYILSTRNMTYEELFNHILSSLHRPNVRGILPRFMRRPLRGIAWFSENWLGSRRFTPDVIDFSWSHRYFDATKARRELGWDPTEPLDVTLAGAVQYYRDHDLIP